MTKNISLHRWKIHSTPNMVIGLQMASTTPVGFWKAVSLTPWGTSQYYREHNFNTQYIWLYFILYFSRFHDMCLDIMPFSLLHLGGWHCALVSGFLWEWVFYWEILLWAIVPFPNIPTIFHNYLIYMDISGHPPSPTGPKHFFGNFGNLLFFAVFNFRGHFEA